MQSLNSRKQMECQSVAVQLGVSLDKTAKRYKLDPAILQGDTVAC